MFSCRVVYEANGSANPGNGTPRSPHNGAVIDLGANPLADRQDGYQLSMRQFFDMKLAAQRSAPETRNVKMTIFKINY
jgi:hypothetical protein